MTKKLYNRRNTNKRINRAFFARRKGIKKWLDRHPDCQRLVRDAVAAAKRLAFDDDPLYPQKHAVHDWDYLHFVSEVVSDLSRSHRVLDYILEQAGTDYDAVSRHVTRRMDKEYPLLDAATKLVSKSADDDVVSLCVMVINYLDSLD